jgi:predicted lactoylglutathione lyase
VPVTGPLSHIDISVAAGGTVLDPPFDYGGRSGYGEFYYAAFFADPDGFKLEVCYVPGANR